MRVDEKPEYFTSKAGLVFAAAPGERNDLSIGITGRNAGLLELTILDSGAPLEAGSGCQGGGPTAVAVRCTIHEPNPVVCAKVCPPPEVDPAWDTSVAVHLGDGDNSFVAGDFRGEREIPMTVDSGPGADRIETGAGEDVIDPGAGLDEVHSNGGADGVYATSEPDGPDLYDLGEEPRTGLYWKGDLLSYERRTEPVVLHGSAATAEGDALTGVDRILGGNGDDSLEGGPGADRLFGGPGDDLLLGGGEDDHLNGQAGDDLSIGGPGDDRIHERTWQVPIGDDDIARGGAGDDLIQLGDGEDRAIGGRGWDWILGRAGKDVLVGGSGGDQLIGGGNRDRLWGGDGPDILISIMPDTAASDGLDEVRCGPGRDTGRADRADNLRDCEFIEHFPARPH